MLVFFFQTNGADLEAVAKMVLMNPQGFIDGAPKVGPLGPLGIKVCHGGDAGEGAGGDSGHGAGQW